MSLGRVRFPPHPSRWLLRALAWVSFIPRHLLLLQRFLPSCLVSPCHCAHQPILAFSPRPSASWAAPESLRVTVLLTDNSSAAPGLPCVTRRVTRLPLSPGSWDVLPMTSSCCTAHPFCSGSVGQDSLNLSFCPEGRVSVGLWLLFSAGLPRIHVPTQMSLLRWVMSMGRAEARPRPGPPGRHRTEQGLLFLSRLFT